MAKSQAVPDRVKPMTFHIPDSLKARLTSIAKAEQRSLTKQMVVMLDEAAAAREKANG